MHSGLSEMHGNSADDLKKKSDEKRFGLMFQLQFQITHLRMMLTSTSPSVRLIRGTAFNFVHEAHNSCLSKTQFYSLQQNTKKELFVWHYPQSCFLQK